VEKGTNDTFGPQISFETISGQKLENGDHFSESEDLIIRFSDPLGINLTNESGHEIQVTDLETGNSETITQDFYYDQNSIITGTVTFNRSTDNDMNIRVQAWDSANNPSEKEIRLSRTVHNEFRIYNAYNYPNPFSTFYTICFRNNTKCRYKIGRLYTRGASN
jgi:hypothetical protein